MIDKQNTLTKKIIGAGLNPPETLTLMITEGCNLSCDHCLLECPPVDQARPVSRDVVLRLVKEFIDLGGKGLVIAGGEPLTHPDWLKILRFACDQGRLEAVRLQTNATLMGEPDIHALMSLPRDKLTLQVSLDGATAPTHDLLRGKGHFDATMKVLRKLSETGLGDQTEVAFTEMRHNYDELPALMKRVHGLGLRRLVSGTLVKSGRSLHADWIALPLESQVQALIKTYDKDPDFFRMYEQIGNIAVIEWHKGRAFDADTTCKCIERPFISARGELYPCVMVLNKDLAVNRLHGRPLAEAVLEGLPKWAELPETSRHRRSRLSACEGCPGRAHCGGGCMGRAEAVHGAFLAVEDRCELRKAVYNYVRRDN